MICPGCNKDLKKVFSRIPIISRCVCESCYIRWHDINTPGFREKRLELARKRHRKRVPIRPGYDSTNLRKILKPLKWTKSLAGKNNSYSYMRTINGRYISGKAYATRRGLVWDIPADEYGKLLSLPCHYCGFELSKTGVGLDRKDNSLGYLITNVVPCCWECNTAKFNFWSYDEMIKYIGPAIRAARLSRSLVISRDC